MIYAKSNPIESLREHTDTLLRELDVLKNAYGKRIEGVLSDIEMFWGLLDIICEFHDLGKVITPFQNSILKNIGLNLLECKLNEVGHNYISPAFINFKKLNIGDDYKDIVVQSILYHHERNVDLRFDDEYINNIKKIVEEDLPQKVDILNKEFSSRYYIKQKKYNINYLERAKDRIREDNPLYKEYVLLKGLLNRLDYSASANVPIELGVNTNVGEKAVDFMKENGYKLNDLQEFALDTRSKNVIAIASTGYGKTETALLWLDNDKGFFTLPLRVSINDIYDRVSKGIGYKEAGLLHSTSLDYLEENGYEKGVDVVNESKLLTKKLTFCTIDQIFKFPFKYKGYERELATLSYSKIVIDEIQAYSPEICAVLIKGLEMISKMGGQFMIMTATMPSIYLDVLKERGVIDSNTAIAKFSNDNRRHRLRVNNRNIKCDIEKIKEDSKTKKVLVIANTIKEALKIYKALGGSQNDNLNLLHSLYINKDRSTLETKIKDFARNEKEKGIWVTTQIVEASLDVDFDVLYTELSSLDSLFQRLGRCNRKGLKSTDEVNVEVYTEELSGYGSVYDKDIVDKGLNLLLDIEGIEEGVLLSEDLKVDLVSELYSRDSLRGTDFYSKFKKALKDLDVSEPYEITKHKAQKILRDIDSNICIPKDVFNTIKDTLIVGVIELNNKIEINEDREVIKQLKERRLKLRNEILKYSVSLPTYRTKDYALYSVDVSYLKDISVIDCDYYVNTKDNRIKGIGLEIVDI